LASKFASLNLDKSAVNDFIDINNNMHRENRNQQILKTEAQQFIVSKLCSYAYNLNNGIFEGSNGRATIAMVGPRGIGKSSTIVKFAKEKM